MARLLQPRPRLERLLRRRKPRPADRTGPGAALLVAVLARPRPQKGVALAGFVIEQVRVDRRVERGVVELEREVVAALFGALRPSCPDLRPAHVDAVAGSVIVGSVGLGDDTDALGLQAQGDDLALEVVADLLERTDVSHVTSPVVLRARDHRGLDGDLQAEDDRRRTRSRAEAQRRTSLRRLSCLARNGRSPGEESRSNDVAAQTI